MLELDKIFLQNQIKNTINQDAAIQHINLRKKLYFCKKNCYYT